MRTRYVDYLDQGPAVRVIVDFASRGATVTDYAVTLVIDRDGYSRTVRVYDGAHGYNEMHRYSSSGGKRSGKPFHSGTLGEGMRAAIEAVRGGYREMIEGWERQ